MYLVLFQVSDTEDVAFLFPQDPSPYSNKVIDFLSKIDEYDIIRKKKFTILYSNNTSYNFGCSLCFHKIFSVLEPTDYKPEILTIISNLDNNYQYISLLSSTYYTFKIHKNEFKRHSVVTFYYEDENNLIQSNFSKLYSNEGYNDNIITDEMYFVYYTSKFWLLVVKKAKFTKPRILKRFLLNYYDTPEYKYKFSRFGNAIGKLTLLTYDSSSSIKVDYSGDYVMNIDPRLIYPESITFDEFVKNHAIDSYTYEHILFVDYGTYCSYSSQKIINGMDAVIDNINYKVYYYMLYLFIFRVILLIIFILYCIFSVKKIMMNILIKYLYIIYLYIVV